MANQERTLTGIKVLEMGQMVSAPYCARIMAALGASVTKVEPVTGDRARLHGPFPGGVLDFEKSGLFLAMNLDKRGITLDPSTSQGTALFHQLVSDADIFVENGPPSSLANHLLAYDALKEINPGLIMVSITPFGQTGPYRDYVIYDLNIWHASGWGYLWRERGADGEPGRPVKAPPYMASFQASYNALTAALGALYCRDYLGGEGQHIDVSEQEVMAFILATGFPIYNEESRIQGKDISIPATVPSGVLPCRDGHVLLSVIEPHQWSGLAEMLGNPDWSRDDWTETIEGRRLNYDVVNAFLMEWLEDKDMNWVVDTAIKHRIPSSPVGITAENLLDDDHLGERQFFTKLNHPKAGTLSYPSAPYKFSGSETTSQTTAPLLGQHNAEIYQEGLGLSPSEFFKLCQERVI